VDHVGIYAGNDELIHAPYTGDVVKVSSLAEPYYDGRFAAARHIAD
jgi:cell wall-associated NlpC family hydrolase